MVTLQERTKEIQRECPKLKDSVRRAQLEKSHNYKTFRGVSYKLRAQLEKSLNYKIFRGVSYKSP
jgi:hypothetical protein